MLKTLVEYYQDLSTWENLTYQELITSWDKILIDEIQDRFRSAFSLANFATDSCIFRENTSNQSAGNQLAVYAVERLSATKALLPFSIEPCSGAGYPDRELKDYRTLLSMPFEIKASSKWAENSFDTNRCVLTSSSNKLRKRFKPPIYHLLCTFLYENTKTNCARISKMRLDFLEPTTPVNIRLEASVNQKILKTGNHDKVEIT